MTVVFIRGVVLVVGFMDMAFSVLIKVAEIGLKRGWSLIRVVGFSSGLSSGWLSLIHI